MPKKKTVKKKDPAHFQEGERVRHIPSGETGIIRWKGETLDNNLFVECDDSKVEGGTFIRVAPRAHFEAVSDSES